MENLKIIKNIECRDNRNGFYTLKTSHGEMITNATGKFIIENLGKFSIKEISDMLSKTFFDNTYEGTRQTENFLYELKNVGLIYFDEEQKNIDGNNKIQIAGEKTYRLISENIISNIDTDHMVYTISRNKKYFHVYPLRSRSFSNRENYFFRVCDGNMSIMGVQNLDSPTMPAQITLLKYGDTLEELLDLYTDVEEMLRELKQYKIRLNVNTNECGDSLKTFINATELNLEGHFVKEDGINDYDLFGKLL